MLQHNAPAARLTKAGEKAHVAHAAMISLHALCCGLPLAALALATLSGVASGTSVLVLASQQVHGLLHSHEYWILVASLLLVAIGGYFELGARRAHKRRSISPLFALSVACLAFNVVLIAAHRGA